MFSNQQIINRVGSIYLNRRYWYVVLRSTWGYHLAAILWAVLLLMPIAHPFIFYLWLCPAMSVGVVISPRARVFLGWPTPEDLFAIDSERIINECLPHRNDSNGAMPQVEKVEFVGPYRGVWVCALIHMSQERSDTLSSPSFYIADYRISRSPVGDLKTRWKGVPVPFELDDDKEELVCALIEKGIISDPRGEKENWDYVIKMMHDPTRIEK